MSPHSEHFETSKFRRRRISLAAGTCALFLQQKGDCGKALVLNPAACNSRDTRILSVISRAGRRCPVYLNSLTDEKFRFGCERVARATLLRKLSLEPNRRIAKSATPGAKAARRISEQRRRRELNCRA